MSRRGQTTQVTTTKTTTTVKTSNAPAKSTFDTKNYEKNGLTEDEVFIDMMTAKMSDKDTREDLEKVFELFLGDDNSDKIDIRHLKRVCKELNENMSDDELNEMIVRADTDRDGKVSFEEFYAIMTKKI